MMSFNHHSEKELTSTRSVTRGNAVFSSSNDGALKGHKHLSNSKSMHVKDNSAFHSADRKTKVLQFNAKNYNNSFLCKVTNIGEGNDAISCKSPLSNACQDGSQNNHATKQVENQFQFIASKSPYHSSNQAKEINQNFSHQHRRRPVYQRCNVDPTFSDSNNCASRLSDMNNPSYGGDPVECSSIGHSSNATSPVVTYPTKKNREVFREPPHQSMSSANPTIRPSSCVYLRPEQNIPDVFVASRRSTTFKPIVESSNGENQHGEKRRVKHIADDSNFSHVHNKSFKGNENASIGGNENDNEASISRDDIVVTMRSVNV